MSGLSPSMVRGILKYIAEWMRQPDPQPVAEARARLAKATRRRDMRAVGRERHNVYVARHDALRREMARKHAAK